MYAESIKLVKHVWNEKKNYKFNTEEVIFCHLHICLKKAVLMAMV
jgi:hypothetical protein